MKIQVRWFASLAERAGTGVETVEVPEGIDVAGLWKILEARHAGLAGIHYRPLAACDLVYAKWEQPLAGVTEVAFLPPLSGG